MCIIIDQYEDLPKRSDKRAKFLDETTQDLIKLFPDQSVTLSATRAEAIQQAFEASSRKAPFPVLADGATGTPLQILRRWITKSSGNSKHGGGSGSGTGTTLWVRNQVKRALFEQVFGIALGQYKHILYAQGEGKEAVDTEIQRGLEAYRDAHPEASEAEINQQRPGMMQEAASRAFSALPRDKQAEYEAMVNAPGVKPPP